MSRRTSASTRRGRIHGEGKQNAPSDRRLCGLVARPIVKHSQLIMLRGRAAVRFAAALLFERQSPAFFQVIVERR